MALQIAGHSRKLWREFDIFRISLNAPSKNISPLSLFYQLRSCGDADLLKHQHDL